MAFQIKKFGSIVASMVNWASSITDKITDFNIGSVVRTIFEAVAIELEELYYQLLKAVEEAIEEAIYRTFNFPRNPPERSTGAVTFFRQGGLAGSPVEGIITVSTGTLVGTDSDPSILFGVQSNEDVVYLSGTATAGGTTFLVNENVDFLALGVEVYEGDTKSGAIVYCLDAADVLQGKTPVTVGTAVIKGVLTIETTVNPNDTLTFEDLTDTASFAGPGLRKYKVFSVWKDISVQAVVPGVEGNVAANSITVLKSGVANVESCNNFSSFNDGKTDESDLERKARFALYIQSLSRATRGALEYAALSIEQIVSAKVVDDVRPTVLVCDYDPVAPVYTDISTPMRTPGDPGVELFPTIQATNDALYIGARETFEYLNLYQTSPGVISHNNLVYEYYREDDIWATLTVIDGTNNGTGPLTQSGVISFIPPTDWVSILIDGLLKMWIRLRVTSAPPGVWTTVPLGDYCSVPPGLGYAWLYCHDGSGNLSASVKALVESVVELYRACGVVVIVRAPYKTTPTVTCSITVAENYSLDEVETQVRQAIVDFLNRKALGEDLYISELYQLIMDTNDKAIINCITTEPSKDILVSSSSVIRADSSLITITTEYGYSA